MRRAALVLALAVGLVLSGCAAPVAGPDAPDRPAPTVEYRDGDLPFEAGPAFHRVQTVLGTNVTAPAGVRVVEDPAELGGGATAGLPRFWRVAGVRAESGLSAADVDRLENGVTTGLGVIVVYPGETADPADEWLLAHEFVHYAQLQTDATARVARAVPTGTTDGRWALRSVVEGAAVYATDAYVDRYGGPDAEPNAALYDRLNDTLRPGSVAWHANLAYVDGRDYVGERVGTASGLSVVYDSPPRTSEQVIHGLSPVEEPAAPLDVTTSGDEWRVAATDRLGEAFLRTALAGTLDAGRAARAAAGWGNDTLYTFRRPDAANGSYAWVQRWDTAADAREYLDAQRDALDERGTAAGDGWRVAGVSVEVRRVGPRTTALVAGDAAFVDGTTVDGDGRDVAVRAP